MNFLISGHPRSGTKFLANLLNRSASWEVNHEVDYERDEFEQTPEHLQTILDRFNKDRYGEVTSCLKWCAAHLPVDKKAIIVRPLKEVWVSIVNDHLGQLQRLESMNVALNPHYKQHVKQQVIDHLDRFIKDTETLHIALESGIPALQFKKLISDVGYVQSLVDWLGIDDLKVSLSMMGVENETASDKIVMTDYDELPDYYKHIDSLEYFDKWIN